MLEEIDEALLNALNSSHVVIRSVAQTYSDCLDSATIEKRGVAPLVEIIQKSLGDWPMLQRQKPAQNNDTAKALSWQDLYVNTYAYTGIKATFDLGVYLNDTLSKPVVNVRGC